MNDFFARLGIPRRFTLDLPEVERLYLAKSRQLHPDFHGGGSDFEQQASLELTAALNEAYVALKDPFRRVEHLLALNNGPTATQEKNLDQAFLMEMMDLRERIDDAKASGRGLAEIENELTKRLSELLNAAGRPFDDGKELSAATLIAIRRQLNSAKTITSLLRDII